jgi:hypothetical protein
MTNCMIQDPYSTWRNAAAECAWHFNAWISAATFERAGARARYRVALDRDETAARQLALALQGTAPRRGAGRRRAAPRGGYLRVTTHEPSILE